MVGSSTPGYRNPAACCSTEALPSLGIKILTVPPWFLNLQQQIVPASGL